MRLTRSTLQTGTAGAGRTTDPYPRALSLSPPGPRPLPARVKHFNTQAAKSGTKTLHFFFLFFSFLRREWGGALAPPPPSSLPRSPSPPLPYTPPPHGKKSIMHASPSSTRPSLFHSSPFIILFDETRAASEPISYGPSPFLCLA